MARILLTGAGGPAGLALARQLRSHEVIGVDMADLGDNARLFTEVHRGPAAVDLALLPFLRDLARRCRVDLLIPTVQDELPVIASAADLLGVPVLSSPSHGVALAHDKLLTAWALADAGVAVPQTVPASELADDTFAFPFLLKPRVSRGGRGVRVIDDAAALASARETGLDDVLLAQAFAPGDEFDVQVYREAGRPASEVIVCRKTELKEGRVGNAAGVERCAPGVDADVAALAARAVEALDLTGPADVDVRRLADGTPVVLEINARFGANSEVAPELLARVLTRFGIPAPQEA